MNKLVDLSEIEKLPFYTVDDVPSLCYARDDLLALLDRSPEASPPVEVEPVAIAWESKAGTRLNISWLTDTNEELIKQGIDARKVATYLYTSPPDSIQQQVAKWMIACFGKEISKDVKERNHRFLEEAVELVQSKDCTRSEAHQLVDYVFDRPVGEPKQEVGGVMVTLAAWCNANNINMIECANTEIARIWTKVEQIREKQANKPKHSPLPQYTPDTEAKLKIAVEALNRIIKGQTSFNGKTALSTVGMHDVAKQALKDIGERNG